MVITAKLAFSKKLKVDEVRTMHDTVVSQRERPLPNFLYRVKMSARTCKSELGVLVGFVIPNEQFVSYYGIRHTIP